MTHAPSSTHLAGVAPVRVGALVVEPAREREAAHEGLEPRSPASRKLLLRLCILWLSSVFDQPFQPDQPLQGALDIEAVAQTFPASYTVKGMFCSRFVELLGDDYAKVEPKLSAAPRAGRYVPFKDYPQSDHTRLAAAAAFKHFQHVSEREALRCIARDDLITFAASMIGKVVLALAGDARTTLLRAPDAYRRVAPGATVSATELDSFTVRLTFEQHRGLPEYIVGQLEGAVLSFGQRPTVMVRKLAETTLAFDVTHRG